MGQRSLTNSVGENRNLELTKFESFAIEQINVVLTFTTNKLYSETCSDVTVR